MSPRIRLALAAACAATPAEIARLSGLTIDEVRAAPPPETPAHTGEELLADLLGLVPDSRDH